MEGQISAIINLIKNCRKIEVINDEFFSDSLFVYQDGELAVAKKLFRYIQKSSIQNFNSDSKYWSFLGCLFSTRDPRLWNYRKSLLLNQQETYDQEKIIYHLALSIDARCSESYETIRWYINLSPCLNLINQEIEFAKILAEKDSSNAVLWAHFVKITQLANQELKEKTFKWALNFFKRHPSNISVEAFIQTFCPNDTPFLISLLQQNTKDIFELPGHESIWYFRRFLIKNLKPFFHSIKIPYRKITTPLHFSTIRYPECSNEELNKMYHQISKQFSIDLSFISKNDLEQNSLTINNLELINELDLVALTRTDSSITEYEIQKKCAEKYFYWILFSIIDD